MICVLEKPVDFVRDLDSKITLGKDGPRGKVAKTQAVWLFYVLLGNFRFIHTFRLS